MRRSRLSPAATLLLCACVWSPREGCSFNLGGGGFGNSDFAIGEVPPDAIDSGRDSRDSSGGTCAVALTDSVPADGEAGVSPWAEIALMFTGDLSPDQLSVVMADGTEGDLSGDGSLWIWRPRMPLRADHPYTLLITACGQQQTLFFTTGQATEVAALLDGQVWKLDLDAAAPVAALDGLLPALLLQWSGTADSMAVQVAHADGADGAAQDFCLPAGSWSLQTRLPQLHLEGALTLSGSGARAGATGGFDLTVLEDGSAMAGSGGVLVALDALSAIGVDTTALCSALTGASQCLEVGGAAFALLSLSGLSASPVSGAPDIVPVAAADCAGCAEGAPVCE